MPLAVGTRLGPYEILAPLGAGGMGEVYRARDTRLDRSVAIKVLPSHLTGDPKRRARFEREAKAISSLNHPHICALFDVGQEQGTDYLVMELVEGQTLSARLRSGALPVDQAVRIGIEIADALDRAHRQGVIHRDLKSGNIILTKSGSKLMDFGLAKRTAESQPGEPFSELPTAAPDLTGERALVGTIPYMSPEQLEGKEADARSDLWALGCVLYEMATGKHAFEGSSQATVIGAIMGKEPQPISQLQPLTPPSLERLVKVCLAKDPDDRLQTAHDLMQELLWIEDRPRVEPTAATPGAPLSRREAVAWAAVAFLMVLLAGRAWLSGREPENRRPLASFDIILPQDGPLAPSADFPLGIGKPALDVSRDGRRLVYVARTGSVLRLRWREMDTAEFREIPGTEGAYGPFLSPDGDKVGFFAQGKLKTVALDGSSVNTLAEAPIGLGGAWRQDGFLYFVPTPGPVYRMPSGGGAAEQVTRPIEVGDGTLDYLHQWPECVPGSDAILFATARGNIYAQSPGAAAKLLLRGGSHPKLPTPGLLTFSRGGRLFAASFDPRRLEAQGEAAPVLDGVRTEGPQSQAHGGAAQAAISADGTLFYVPGRDSAESVPVWVDRHAKEEVVGLPADTYGTPSISLDGRRLAVVIRDAGLPDVWIYDLERRVKIRVSKGERATDPVWLPDGAGLIYVGLAGERRSLIRVDDNGGSRQVLTGRPGEYSSISPDGRSLAYSSLDKDLWIAPLERPEEGRAFLRTPAHERFPQFSADGRWLAYTSDESGRWEVYVRPVAGPGGRYQVSSAGGEEARWSRDGSELLYRYGKSWFAVPIRAGAAFAAGTPRHMFEGPYINVSGYSYDVAPDGRLIVLKNPQQTQPANRLRVVLNWSDEARRRIRSD